LSGTIIFPLIFGWILWNVLPGGPTGKAVAWGLILWVLSQAIVTPMMGGGVFRSTNAGRGRLLCHYSGIVYGAILGAVTGAPAVRVGQETPSVPCSIFQKGAVFSFSP
jgi:hypothetical protein